MSQDLLPQIIRASAALAEAAIPYQGLVPAQLDRATGKRPATATGSNLMHDLPLFGTWRALTEHASIAGFGQAADLAVKTFLTVNHATPGGLLPWGGGASWDLDRWAPGTGTGAAALTHDHVNAVPDWFWRQVYTSHPAVGLRFCTGLQRHWTASPVAGAANAGNAATDDLPEFHRRAPLLSDAPATRDATRSWDDPRHGGYYIVDLAHALTHSGDDDLRLPLQAFMDHGWNHRTESGLVPLASRLPAGHPLAGSVSPTATLNLAVSLFAAADLVEESKPRVALSLRMRASRHVEGFLGAAHDLKEGRVAHLCHGVSGTALTYTSIWNPVATTPSTASPAACLDETTPSAAAVGLAALAVFRVLEDDRLLGWAEALGRAVLRAPFPASADTPIPARDAGFAVALLADLYDLTGDVAWLDRGAALADTVVAAYLDRPLPRGLSHGVLYDNQYGPGYLLHGLSRFALLRAGCDTFPPDFTSR